MKKFFMLVLAFFGLTTLFATCNMNVDAVSQDIIVKDGRTFNKITDVSEVTEGNYIIGNSGNYAAGQTGTNKYINRVTSSAEAIIYTFTSTGAEFQIQNSTTKEYFSYKGCSKNNLVEEPNIADALTFTFSIKDNLFSIKASNNRFLQYNSSKSQERFALYTGTQKNIVLFKEQNDTPQLKEFTVTLNTMGGNTLEPIVGYEGKALTNLPVPTKDGFSFDGWYKEETLITKWDEETDVVTGNMTLYAKWVESPFITINTLANLKCAEYYLGADNRYVVSIGSNNLQLGNDINKAIKFTIYTITDGKIIIKFDNNGTPTYVKPKLKDTDIEFETKLSNDVVLDIREENNTLALKNGVDRTLAINGDILKFYSDKNKYPVASFHKIKNTTFNINEFYMSFVETKASLKLEYKVDTLEATDVDLRFGTIVDKTLYNANAKYGVVAVKSTSNINLTQGLQDATNIADFVAKNQGAKNVEATPVEVANGYQFAWVINNIEEQELKYNEEFIAAVYMELDGKLYFATPKTASVLSVRDTYINDKLDIPANVLEVLKKLA